MSYQGRYPGHELKKAIMRRVKELFPCDDCGNYFSHYVMQWDHVPERTAERIPYGSALYQWSWERIMGELAQCDLVCSNCHWTRTFERKGYPTYSMHDLLLKRYVNRQEQGVLR